jgi:hypothetical protein
MNRLIVPAGLVWQNLYIDPTFFRPVTSAPQKCQVPLNERLIDKTSVTVQYCNVHSKEEVIFYLKSILVDLKVDTNVSEEYTAPIISPEDVFSMLFRNVGILPERLHYVSTQKNNIVIHAVVNR